MFGWEFPPHNSGGLGTACEGLTKALAARGAEIVLVLPRPFSNPVSYLRLVCADIDPLITLRPVRSRLRPYLANGRCGFNLLSEVEAYARRARELVPEEDFDLIHAHDWLAFPAGLVAKELSGKPLVVHVHATEFDRTGGEGANPEVYQIEQTGLRVADQIVAVSQWTKNLLIEKYGVSSDKVSVIHNGIEANEYQPLPPALDALKAAGAKIVLFVGRITLQKGPDYFVRVAKQVLQYEPNTYFVMAGNGDMRGAVMRLAIQLGVMKHFLFPGFLRGEELNQVYQAADLFILPSVSEPFGITPLEALANGAPVLVSKQSGVAEVLTHALKVDFWDLEEMANKIVSVLRHPPLQTTLRSYGGREVKKVSWRAAASKCLAVYQELLNPKTI